MPPEVVGHLAHAPDEPATDVFRECVQAPPDRPHLMGVRKAIGVLAASKDHDPDHIRAGAEPLRARFEQLYGGHWIAIVTQPRPDDGLCGQAARRRAYERVLAGPDTPGRSYLQTLLARRTEPSDHLDIAEHALRHDEPAVAHR